MLLASSLCPEALCAGFAVGTASAAASLLTTKSVLRDCSGACCASVLTDGPLLTLAVVLRRPPSPLSREGIASSRPTLT